MAGARRVQGSLGLDGACCTYADRGARAEDASSRSTCSKRAASIDARQPGGRAFVAPTLKDVVMHEVGHTLGLRHNFRASTVYTQAQLADPSSPRQNGISGSVMDYNAVNIALQGRAAGRVRR